MRRALPVLIILTLAAPAGAQPRTIGYRAQRPNEPARPQASSERVLYNPPSVPAAQVKFLKESDMVIGVAQRGAAKAYWLPMVIWTHFIQDRLGDLPILVTW